MPINPDFLVASGVLQQYLVDKDTGTPLTNGRISLFVDTNRQIFKNWYYQTGTPGAYDYIALDNPLYLSSVGTIQDPNGNDVIPFYYPLDEDDPNITQKYYVTVYSTDQDGNAAVLQSTRENWPPINDEGGGGNTKGNTLRNYIINNIYWRNGDTIDCTDVLNVVVAPSQHDGYLPDYTTSIDKGTSDIRFRKSKTGANDQIQFLKMVDSDLTLTSGINSQITPEYYLNMSCSASTTGETLKCIQFPVSLHLDTLDDVNATLLIWARNAGEAASATITLTALPFTGTDNPIPGTAQSIGSMTLGSSGDFEFAAFQFTFTKPTFTSATGDDGWFILVNLPTNANYNIDLTKVQLYLGAAYADNDFDTYDQISAITSSARTGDIRTSLNNFTPYGWIPANNGVISNSGVFTLPTGVPSARQNIDTWPLFYLIWTNVSNAFAPIYSSAGSLLLTRSASAYDDWNANNQLQLTQNLGRALIGLPPVLSVTYTHGSAPTWNSGTAGFFTVAAGQNTQFLYQGTPIILTGTLPGAFTADVVYYAIPAIDGSSSTQFQLATTYNNAIAGTAIAAVGISDGSDLVVNFQLGGTVGQSRHLLLAKELPTSFSVNLNSTTLTDVGNGGETLIGITGSGNTSITLRNNAVGDQLFNEIPPSSYMNVFLKL